MDRPLTFACRTLDQSLEAAVDGSVGEPVPGHPGSVRSRGGPDRRSRASRRRTVPGSTRPRLRRVGLRSRCMPVPDARRCRRRTPCRASASALTRRAKLSPTASGCRVPQAARSVRARRSRALRFRPQPGKRSGRRRSSGSRSRKSSNAWRACFSLSCRDRVQWRSARPAPSTIAERQRHAALLLCTSSSLKTRSW